MHDNKMLAFADAETFGLPRCRGGLPIQGPRDDVALTWTPVTPTVRAQEEVLLIAHINALRAEVATFPAWRHLSKRRRQTIRKLEFLEMFLEKDSGSEWGQERLSKDWPATPQSLFFVAGALLGPPGPNCLFRGLRIAAH